MRTPTHILARLALWPLSLPYRGALRLRATAYRVGWARTARIDVPVVSIGNLSVGGTGKTPLVELLCRLLERSGLRPAVISRGYGRQGGDSLTVVSRGDGSGPRVDVATAGDEPFLLAQALPRTAVVVCADRVAAARAAVDDLGVQVIVADDAYQHIRLQRDVDFLVINATNPVEAGWLLPSGGLREPLEAAGRASAFLLTHCDRIGETTQAEELYRRHNTEAPFFRTVTRPVDLLSPDGERTDPQDLHGEPVLALCGIARPRFFRQDLERLGARVVDLVAHPDHHWFTDDELRAVAERARSEGASAVVTTEKDYARLSPEQRASFPLYRLRIRAEAWEERQLLKFLLRRLGREAAA